MTLKLSHEITNVIVMFLAVCGVAVLIYILQYQRKIVFGARIKWRFLRRKGKKYKKKSGTTSKRTKSNKKL